MAGEEGPMRRCTTRSVEEEEALAVTDLQAPSNCHFTTHTAAAAAGGIGPVQGLSTAGELPMMGHCSSHKRKAASDGSSVENTADAAVVVTGAFEGMKPADSATGADGFGNEEPPVPEGKIRLSKEWVEFVLAMDRKPFLDLCNEIVNAAEPGPYLSQELADETRKVYLAAAKDHEEVYDWIAEIQNGFRRQYELKGVVDVDDDYYEKVEKAKQANRAAYLKVFGGADTDVSGQEE